MGVIPIREAETVGGTLLWIGDPTLPEFHHAQADCVANAPQVALRRNPGEAIARPADHVGRVVLARNDRFPLIPGELEKLARQHPNAEWLELLGPLCEGTRCRLPHAARRVAWHRWDQVFPGWFGTRMPREQRSAAGSASVVVLSNHFDTAQTYLDLAASLGMVAAWCDVPSRMRIRNCRTVWWDDSVAGPTTRERWRQRLDMFAAESQTTFHVWITHDHGLLQRRAAIEGGIDVVISKPYEIDALLQTVERRRTTATGQRQAA